MKIIVAAALMSLPFLAACTVEQRGGKLESEFHPPLTYPQWTTEHATLKNGAPVCVISSGYNALSVLVRRDGADAAVSVKSNRLLPPGTFLTVNVNGHRYETREEFFSDRESSQIADDLTAGGKAYAEWSEPHPSGNGLLRYATILKTEDFASQFAQCKEEITSVAKAPKPIQKSHKGGKYNH